MTSRAYPFDWTWASRFNVNENSLRDEEERIVRLVDDIPKNEGRIGWLLKAITFIDLTSLNADDTCSTIKGLCVKARTPVLCISKMDLNMTIRPAAVCVYPSRIADAVEALKDKNSVQMLPVAAVAAGFPHGQYSLKSRLAEIQFAVDQGATEIDVVIDRSLAITGQWRQLYDELKAMKEACGTAHMKTILAVGELPTMTHVYRASVVAMMAGSDFIKTSTGKETVNATIPVGIVMARAILDFYFKTGAKVGLKAAGGIKTAKDALTWMVLVKEILNRDWLEPKYFRIGASSLLGDIENEIGDAIVNIASKD